MNPSCCVLLCSSAAGSDAELPVNQPFRAGSEASP
jgi:hypothetical protein